MTMQATPIGTESHDEEENFLALKTSFAAFSDSCSRPVTIAKLPSYLARCW